ncbi:MAG: hypothetical protein GY759_03375 [Chloroflexi bacterium]|nr:hypothetical protein [Chloroflexota bacterium]
MASHWVLLIILAGIALAVLSGFKKVAFILIGVGLLVALGTLALIMLAVNTM